MVNLILPEIKVNVSFDKKVKKSDLYVIKSSKDAADLFRQIFDADTFDWKEEFIMLCLKNAKVVGYYKVSAGGITGTVADPRVIFTIALNCLATKIIVAHNHPSGSLKPSRQDIELTQKIKSAGEVLDIKLYDHLIVTSDSYLSMAEESYM